MRLYLDSSDMAYLLGRLRNLVESRQPVFKSGDDGVIDRERVTVDRSTLWDLHDFLRMEGLISGSFDKRQTGEREINGGTGPESTAQEREDRQVR